MKQNVNSMHLKEVFTHMGLRSSNLIVFFDGGMYIDTRISFPLAMSFSLLKFRSKKQLNDPLDLVVLELIVPI